jgi:hypothetical protein
MSDRLQPAFWGGLLIGVLSGLPFVNIGNCCCCLWVLLGGGLAVYLRQQNSPFQIMAGEGALVGLMAGVVGAVVCTILSIPLQLIIGAGQEQALERILSNPDFPPEGREVVERFFVGPGRWIVGLIVTLIVFPIFGALGGLLGVAIFKKNLPPPPPPGTIDVPPSPSPMSTPTIPTPPPPPPPPSL